MSISPFLPPWCHPGCPIGPFLPPWCLVAQDCLQRPPRGIGLPFRIASKSALVAQARARVPSPVVLIMRRASRGGGGIRTRDLSCRAGGTARKNLTYISSGAGPAAPDRIRKAAPDKILSRPAPTGGAGQDTPRSWWTSATRCSPCLDARGHCLPVPNAWRPRARRASLESRFRRRPASERKRVS